VSAKKPGKPAQKSLGLKAPRSSSYRPKKGREAVKVRPHVRNSPKKR
jgi:hypothetical protein